MVEIRRWLLLKSNRPVTLEGLKISIRPFRCGAAELWAAIATKISKRGQEKFALLAWPWGDRRRRFERNLQFVAVQTSEK